MPLATFTAKSPQIITIPAYSTGYLYATSHLDTSLVNKIKVSLNNVDTFFQGSGSGIAMQRIDTHKDVMEFSTSDAAQEMTITSEHEYIYSYSNKSTSTWNLRSFGPYGDEGLTNYILISDHYNNVQFASVVFIQISSPYNGKRALKGGLTPRPRTGYAATHPHP